MTLMLKKVVRAGAFNIMKLARIPKKKMRLHAKFHQATFVNYHVDRKKTKKNGDDGENNTNVAFAGSKIIVCRNINLHVLTFFQHSPVSCIHKRLDSIVTTLTTIMPPPTGDNYKAKKCI